MRLAIAAGPTVDWLLSSHDLPSKFSAIARRIWGRRNRAVKVVTVAAVLLVPNFIL